MPSQKLRPVQKSAPGLQTPAVVDWVYVKNVQSHEIYKQVCTGYIFCSYLVPVLTCAF